VHLFVIEKSTRQVTEEQAQRLADVESKLTGAMRSMRDPVTLQTGQTVRPPSWWIDDDDATASMFAAMTELGGGADAR